MPPWEGIYPALLTPFATGGSVDLAAYTRLIESVLTAGVDGVYVGGNIGEIRTRETMQHAVTFAETGHLCLATLHANNANQALDRIQNFFPADARDQLWMDLSLNPVSYTHLTLPTSDLV